MRKTSILKAGTAPIALGLMLAAVPAYAQDQTESEEATEEPGQILVTGSRIARPDLESASPVASVTGETISLTGTLTLEELINDLPQVIPGNNRTSNNSGGEAFATLDLRGLGPNRTLILVDGERIAPSSTTGSIDISQIPTALI
jgi:outer membrane cobalamin receptor